MRNYYLFLLLIGAACWLHSKQELQPTEEKPVVKVVDIPIFWEEAIALVKYNGMVYRCYSVQAKECGYSLRCNGGLLERCAQVEEIEWISREI